MREQSDLDLAALMARLRTPLARIELAASRLARSASTPGARALSSSISDAVAEIDERIGAGLDALLGVPSSGAPREDCRSVIAALRQRMDPVVRAHGIEWCEPTASGSEEPVLGDRQVARGAAVALLQGGIELTRPGGRIALSLCGEAGDTRYALSMEIDPARASSEDERMCRSAALSDNPFVEAHEFARAHGGALEVREDGDRIVVTASFEPEAGQ